MIYQIKIWFRFGFMGDEKDMEIYPIEADSKEEAEKIARTKKKHIINIEFV